MLTCIYETSIFMSNIISEQITMSDIYIIFRICMPVSKSMCIWGLLSCMIMIDLHDHCCQLVQSACWTCNSLLDMQLDTQNSANRGSELHDRHAIQKHQIVCPRAPFFMMFWCIWCGVCDHLVYQEGTSLNKASNHPGLTPLRILFRVVSNICVWINSSSTSPSVLASILLMIDFYCFENTHKTNWFDSDWGTRQKWYKNKNIIIITSKESRVDHDDDD